MVSSDMIAIKAINVVSDKGNVPNAETMDGIILQVNILSDLDFLCA